MEPITNTGHERLIMEAEAFVNNFFAQHDTSQLYFHNLAHTQHVVKRAAEICAHEAVSEEDQVIIRLATWFHDTGHLTGDVTDHEQRSVLLMREFMAARNVTDTAFIDAIADCILATRLPHNPSSPREQIMCDADVYHFGTAEFQETNKAVKKELIARGHEEWTEGWLQKSFRMLAEQHFFTHYCQETLAAGKQENVEWLTKKLDKKGKKPDTVLLQQYQADVKAAREEEKAAKEEEKQNQRLVARGVQTVLRLASSNHIELSRMADGKANILISVNSIIISVILSVLIRRLDVDPYLTIPTIIFLTSSVITVVLAILSTRPKLTEGTFSREDIQQRKTNLLFFGNFYRSTLAEYEWAMGRLLEDKDYIHGTQIMDIYFLGKVLGHKYKLIRLAYTIFMLGLIIAVIAFTVAVLMNASHGNVTVIDSTTSPL